MRAVVAILAWICAFCNVTHAITVDDAQQIINQGKNFLFRDNPNPDSAVICFRKVVDSYTPSLSLEQKEKCGSAANNLGFANFYYTFDYRAAYEALLKAREICRETGKPSTTVNVLINTANIYTVFSEQTQSPELLNEGITLYKEAFRVAAENQLWHQILTVFNNLTSLRNGLTSLLQFEDEISVFSKLPIPPDTPNYNYTMLRMHAVEAVIIGDLPRATTFFKAQIDNIDADMTVEAYKSQALTLTSASYRLRNMPDSALFYAYRYLDYANKMNLAEAKVNARLIIRNLLSDMGYEDLARQMYGEYLMAKDSLLHIRGLDKVDNIKFMNQLKAERRLAASQLADAERKQKIRELVIFFAGLIIVIVVPLLIVILNRHRTLNKSYLALYQKQQAILRAEDENRRLREEEMRTSAIHENKNANSYSVPENVLSQKTHILSIMDETPEKFSPEFSLTRLAELVGISSRALSAVLNDSMGITFRDLLNQYRVREACARLEDQVNYGNLTIEAITQSVGYKSRTSLVTAFKKETGLTPSDYQRIARKSKS